MKKMKPSILFFLLFLLSISSRSFAQCATGVSPSYPSGCTSQYFTSITATGTGVISTIGYASGSCIGSFFDDFLTQGVTAPTGTTVNININRLSSYYAYLAVYVDWNNNGTYELSELVGTITALPVGTASFTYSFTIPLIGIATNTNIHMRVFLGEPPSAGGPLSSINPPCGAKWGESIDYYLDATCTTPTLSVSPASPSVCGPTGSITLTASGAGPTPTYTWTPTATLSPATGAIVTSTPGTTTTYTVIGYGPGVCLATVPVTVTVNPVVTPAITPGGPTTFCPGGSVTLAETSGTGTLYQWYNGTTLIPGATNSSYTASPATTTTYSVTVTSAAGCSGGTTATVTILATPAATITPSATTVCSPATITLTANFLPGYTFRWFNSSGVISGAVAQTYTASASGTYSVEITASTGCKDTSSGVAITINPSPVATATASGTLTFCSYSSVVLTAGATPGYTYQWLDGLTPIAGATNVSYTATITGTHDYRVKVTNGLGCSDTTSAGSFPVVVNPAPVSAITASGPLSFCTGSSVTLSVPFVAGYTYQWYFGVTVASATPISGGTSASYTTSTSGYYYVKVTTPAGCTTNSAAAPALVTVVDLPVIHHTTPLAMCWGSHVSLSLGISPTAPGITFQWMRNTISIPGATSSSFDATQAGSYTCLVNVSGSCIGTTPSVTITVNPLPDPIVTYTGGYLKTSTAYTSYQWYRNLVPIAGATTYQIIPLNTADYSVIVTDGNGCISEATSYIVHSVILSASQVSGYDAPSVYPNPATNKVYVQYAQNVNIRISGMDGKILIEQSSAKEADIASLPYGVYVISLYYEQGNRLLTEKLVKH